MKWELFIMAGFIVGIISGMIGIGGGLVLIPALVLLFGFSQKMAQGTTLAMMVPPIGLLAALAYYKRGYVDLPVAGLLCIGFFIGGWVGGKWATNFSSAVLEKTFGVFLLLVSLKMIFSK